MATDMAPHYVTYVVELAGLIGETSHDGAEHVTDEVFNAASHLFGGLLSVLGRGLRVGTNGSSSESPLDPAGCL